MANPVSARARALSARALAPLLTLALAACGGGGSGTPGPDPISAPSTPVTVSAANGAQVAAWAVEIALGGTGLVQALPLAVAVDADAAPARRILPRIASDARRRASRAASDVQTVTGAVQSEPCAVSGSVTLSQSATSVSITFHACSDYPGEVVNGTIALSGVSESGDGTSGTASGTMSVNLTVTDPTTTVRFVGGMSFTETWTATAATFQMGGAYLGFTDGVNSQVLTNFSFEEALDDVAGIFTSSSSFTLASTAIGGVVTVSTPTAFQRSYGSAYPFAGALVVAGAGGGKVRLTVLGDEWDPSYQVEIEIDGNGDGIPELTLLRDWYELSAG